MVKARSNTLKLKWRDWAIDDKECLCCRGEIETIEHFVLDCSKLEHIRIKYIELQRPRIEQRDEIMVNLLMFGEKDGDYYVNILWEMWKERMKLITAGQ